MDLCDIIISIHNGVFHCYILQGHTPWRPSQGQPPVFVVYICPRLHQGGGGGVTPTPNINAYTKGTLCKRPIARADYTRQLIRAIWTCLFAPVSRWHNKHEDNITLEFSLYLSCNIICFFSVCFYVCINPRSLIRISKSNLVVDVFFSTSSLIRTSFYYFLLMFLDFSVWIWLVTSSLGFLLPIQNKLCKIDCNISCLYTLKWLCIVPTPHAWRDFARWTKLRSYWYIFSRHGFMYTIYLSCM